MTNVPLKEVSNILTSINTLNENFERIEKGFQETLSRTSGGAPNQMEVMLDMNRKPIINLPKADRAGMPLTYDQLDINTQQVISVPVGPNDFTSDPDDLEQIAEVLQVKQSDVGAVSQSIAEALSGFVHISRFGAKGDGVTDDTLAVASAAGSGRAVFMGDYICRVTSKVILNQPSTKFFSNRSGGFLYDGPNTARLFDIVADDVSLEGVIIDGNSKQPRSGLVYVDEDVKSFNAKNNIIQNIYGEGWGTTPLNQMYAFLISLYGVENFEISGNIFRNIKKLNDGSLFPEVEGIGFVGAICFGNEDHSEPTKPQPVPTRGQIFGNQFDDIQTILAAGLSTADRIAYDDADAIRVYGNATGASTCEVIIDNNTFNKVSKRIVKSSAKGVVVTNAEVYADRCQYPMVTAIKLNENNIVRGVNVYTTALKPLYTAFQYSGFAGVTNDYLNISKVMVTHCLNAWEIIAGSNADTLQNISITDFEFLNVYDLGITQQAPLPASQKNITIENGIILGGAVNAMGVNIPNALDGTCGVRMKQVYVKNAGVKITGDDLEIDGLKVVIDNSNFAGANANDPVVVITPGKGNTRKVNINNLTIDCPNINRNFTTAIRPWIVNIQADKLNLTNFSLSVPDDMDQTYTHARINGDDVKINGLDYYGPGWMAIGFTLSASRVDLRNVTRRGGGSSSSVFLYFGNASNSDILIEGVTDFRPTDQFTIQIASGARYVVNNVTSNTSNPTIVQHGGLAKTTNVQSFS